VGGSEICEPHCRIMITAVQIDEVHGASASGVRSSLSCMCVMVHVVVVVRAVSCFHFVLGVV
jgi:hypothetical protein